MMNYLFLLTEVGISLLFLVCLIHAIKNNKKSIYLLLFGIIYALIFENGNIILSGDKVGGYYYNTQFSLFIYQVPFFVALAWGIIIYTSKHISDSLPIKESSKTFATALLVLLVDLAIDVVAIRLNFWTWRGYSFTDGYFGVPADNFIGWLMISFTFFYFIYFFSKNKVFNKKDILKYFFATTLGYLVFLVFFIPLDFFGTILNLSKASEFFVLVILLAVFLLSIRTDKNAEHKMKKETRYIIYLTRGSFYLFGLITILINKIYLENFLLLVFSIFFIGIEIILMKFERFEK